MRAAKSAGLTVDRIEIDPTTGKIAVIIAKSAENVPQAENPWDVVLVKDDTPPVGEPRKWVDVVKGEPPPTAAAIRRWRDKPMPTGVADYQSWARVNPETADELVEVHRKKFREREERRKSKKRR